MAGLFDPHIHMDTRSCQDYELMALAGIRRILVPCSPTQERRFCREAYGERFDKLTAFERSRAASFGITLQVALSVNAADMGNHRSACEGIEEVDRRLDRECVVAVGELALRNSTPEEVDVFERQLALSTARGLPAIVEAPIEPAAFERCVEVLEDCLSRGLARPERVCMVDLDPDKLRRARALKLGGYGLPVSPRIDGPFALRRKLDHREVLQVLEDSGPEGLMLNSGLHVGYADPLCFARTVLRLELQGLAAPVLRALAYDNADRFFRRHVH